MKKLFLLFLCLSIGLSAFGQAAGLERIDLGQVDLADLDLTQADLSKASLYFAGPVDLMITDVYYMGLPYTALLKHDGYGIVEIAVPDTVSPEGMPVALDLSEIRFSIADDGIHLGNIIADGYYFSGKLVPTPTLDLAVVPPINMGGPAGAADLSDDVAKLGSEITTLRRNLSNEQSARTEAERNLATARTRITALETQLRTVGVAQTPEEVLRGITRTVKSGWTGGTAVKGSWSPAGDALRQTAANDLYAKYVIPVQQNANELVYTFRGSGSSTGWSGYGLHFLGSGSRDGKLYGFGSSYLVWVTRDPSHTQSTQTFVQLYRSYDDVRMVQLASKAISGTIGQTQDLTVYVNRTTGTIVIGAGGKPVIEFEDPGIIRTGSQVAARALGAASVSNLQIRSR